MTLLLSQPHATHKGKKREKNAGQTKTVQPQLPCPPAGRGAARGPPSPPRQGAAAAGRPAKVARIARAIRTVLYQLNAAVEAQGRRLDVVEATSAFEGPPPPRRAAAAPGGGGGRR